MVAFTMRIKYTSMVLLTATFAIITSLFRTLYALTVNDTGFINGGSFEFTVSTEFGETSTAAFNESDFSLGVSSSTAFSSPTEILLQENGSPENVDVTKTTISLPTPTSSIPTTTSVPCFVFDQNVHGKSVGFFI